MEVIKPYIDSGVVKIVADQWVDNWDAAEALKMMENILTAQGTRSMLWSLRMMAPRWVNCQP